MRNGKMSSFWQQMCTRSRMGDACEGAIDRSRRAMVGIHRQMRRKPLRSLLIAAGAGLVLAQLLRRRD